MRRIFFLILTTIVFVTEANADWNSLAPGMEIRTFSIFKTHKVDDLRITIVRIDPTFWELVLTGKSWHTGTESQTAKQWCENLNLSAAINAGMYATDYTTHVGYLASKVHVNNAHVNKYMSVAAFGPKDGKDLPAFRIFDLDDPRITMKTIREDFDSVVQNLRLIKRPGENRWPRQNKMWSEAALGEDRSGRVLFIFVKSPVVMYDLNRALLSLNIGLVAAQHLEGGPEAQLYVRIGDVTREMFGNDKTAFRRKERKNNFWPIPNIIGVRPKP